MNEWDQGLMAWKGMLTIMGQWSKWGKAYKDLWEELEGEAWLQQDIIAKCLPMPAHHWSGRKQATFLISFATLTQLLHRDWQWVCYLFPDYGSMFLYWQFHKAKWLISPVWEGVSQNIALKKRIEPMLNY